MTRHALVAFIVRSGICAIASGIAGEEKWYEWLNVKLDKLVRLIL